MRKLVAVLTAAALAGAAWYVTQHYEIGGLEALRFTPRTAAPETATSGAGAVSNRSGDRVRVASFDFRQFNDFKARQPNVIERLAHVVRQFDVVAVQEVCSPSDEPLVQLLRAVNATGRKYEYLVSPPIGRAPVWERYAFLFDTESLETDHFESYVVNDPQDLLRFEPYVAWFRVRGVPTAAAFTFTLVNAHVDPEQLDHELEVLADVFLAVRNDGRGEDDVILLGNLNTEDRLMGRLGDMPRMTCAIAGMPTNTRGDAQLDNLVFDSRATNEFTGRVGVFDVLREFNLTLDESLEISDHLPVWAEFSVYEGGRPGRVAVAPPSAGAR